MFLEAGRKLGPYEIIAPIGKGGMGEVFRARDTKLERDVAIKVLPEEFASDQERLARFEREAKLLASLNHPNIASIHGFEESEGVKALVLELIEGPTLAERIAHGPIPPDETIAIAKQIAEALEAGHETGVVHRDLKPANIKLKEDGTVKVLDYGLAKALEGDTPNTPDFDLSQSPTLTRQGTQVGVILGTAAYMSPEQAKGKRVDRRTDIWAFGAVLYEMLTGKRAFSGDDVAETLAAVLRAEPNLDVLPDGTPESLRLVLRLCSSKKITERFQSIGDVRLALNGVFETVAAPESEASALSTDRIRWPAIVAASLLGALMATVAWRSRSEPPRPVVRVVATPPSAEPVNVTNADVDIAITPDGSRIVYSAMVDGQRTLLVRAMDQLEAQSLGRLGNSPRGPFVSPDGKWVGFINAGGALRKAPIIGGPVATICDLSGAGNARGASWGPDDTIIFATSGPTGLLSVAASGGEPEELTTRGAGEGDHLWPEILPGGESVLFTITGGDLESSQIAVLSLVTRESKILIQSGYNARYVTAGYIVYGAGGVLRAVGFDVEQLEVTSDPVRVLEGVGGEGATEFAVSQHGSLLYVSGSAKPQKTVVWVGRDGREETFIDEPGSYADVRISPDGTKVAVDMSSSQDPTDAENVWIYEVARGGRTRLTTDGGMHSVWSPDGTRVAFGTSGNSPDLYWASADGSGAPEALLTGQPGLRPDSWSPDGVVAFSVGGGSGAGRDIWTMPYEGEATPFLATPFMEDGPMFSPDGNWLAYVSEESGRKEVYVQRYPGSGAKWSVSTEGGRAPTWSGKGDELFYRSLDGTRMMVVPVELGAVFVAGAPRVLFEGQYFAQGPGDAHYDVSRDGQRFLMISEGRAGDSTDSGELILVQNWHHELERLVPTQH